MIKTQKSGSEVFSEEQNAKLIPPSQDKRNKKARKSKIKTIK